MYKTSKSLGFLDIGKEIYFTIKPKFKSICFLLHPEFVHFPWGRQYIKIYEKSNCHY